MNTEYDVRLYMNGIFSKSNGGGNPYHDAEGKFTEGPSTAFKEFSCSQNNNRNPYSKVKDFDTVEDNNFVLTCLQSNVSTEPLFDFDKQTTDGKLTISTSMTDKNMVALAQTKIALNNMVEADKVAREVYSRNINSNVAVGLRKIADQIASFSQGEKHTMNSSKQSKKEVMYYLSQEKKNLQKEIKISGKIAEKKQDKIKEAYRIASIQLAAANTLEFIAKNTEAGNNKNIKKVQTSDYNSYLSFIKK